MFSWGEDADAGFGSRTTNGPNAASTESGVHFTHLKVQITALSAGCNVIAYTRSDGKVFVGRTHETQDGRRVRGKLKNVNCKGRMRGVSCGDDAVILLSEEGTALCLDRANTPRSLAILCNIQVSQVACGDQHSVALTKDGQVYTWGQDSTGQLGLGKGKHSAESLQKLKSLSAIPLVQIAAGGDQSFALSVSGSVFGWGKNNCGQLGLGDTTDRHTPTPVQCLDAMKTGSISCGKDHTAILTKGGVVFTFGCGQYGQLGHDSFSDELRPRPVELCGAKVTKIACGRHHTLLLTDSKKVYSFGCGEQGQLGHGEGNHQSVPLPIQLSQDTTDGHEIRNIYAGGNCSFATCTFDEDVHEEANSHSVNHMTQQSLDDVIDKWVNECNSSKSWKKIQKEIKRMFSSASCMNRSFLDTSSDKHFQTSPKYSGLKLSLARIAFKTLSKSNQVLTEVEAVVMRLLLPSLDERPIGVEGLRVYLLLTELLHVIQKHTQRPSTDLAEAAAAAILRLPSDSLQVLGDWWSSLKRPTMIKYVEVWKQALSQILPETALTVLHSTGVKHLLQVLQLLYNANKKIAGPRRVAESTFCLEEIEFNPIFLSKDLMLWRSLSKKQRVNDERPILCCFPFVMNLQCRKMVFDLNAEYTQVAHQRAQMTGMNFIWPFLQTPSNKFFELRLKRASLLEDTFEQLSYADCSEFKKPLVVYLDEESNITDVYKKDFFLHLFDTLMNDESGMFMYNDSKTLAWFPPGATLGETRYFLFGLLCGLALYNQSIIHLPFSMALFKKLLNVEPSLEDMVEFSPDVGKSLRYILHDYVDDDIENLDMYFSVVWDGIMAELDPQNPGKPVTSQNKKEFVDHYVNHAFNASVEKVFEEFKRGFFKVCDQDVVELFWPEELKGLMVGKEIYDWGKLKQNAVYEGQYHKSHPNILMFWEVFEELTEDQKKDFLLFLTGFDRVPILGMDQVQMTVEVLLNSSEQHFPKALTCYSILRLPLYSTKETLKARLTEALSHNQGFVN